MESIVLKNKEYKVDKEFTPDSFVVSLNDKKFVLKRFESLSEFHIELNKRKKLKKFGINIPKVVKKFKKDLTLLIEHISEETMLDTLIKGDIEDEAFKELFNIYRFARFSKIELDYHPENYALKKGRMYYLSLDFGEANKDHNLENEGLFYWIYSPKFVEHLKELKLPIDEKRKLTQPEANKKIVLISIMHW